MNRPFVDAAIAKLPLFDMSWSEEIKASWWYIVEMILAEIRKDQSPPKQCSSYKVSMTINWYPQPGQIA